MPANWGGEDSYYRVSIQGQLHSMDKSWRGQLCIPGKGPSHSANALPQKAQSQAGGMKGSLPKV